MTAGTARNFNNCVPRKPRSGDKSYSPGREPGVSASKILRAPAGATENAVDLIIAVSAAPPGLAEF
jgi:hypothetical protein